jgi:carboxypeptidase Taq
MSASLHSLKIGQARIAHLSQAAGLLSWDQQTYMPPGAAAARAEQAATLSETIHGLATSRAYGDLLARAEQDTAGQDTDSDDVRMLRVARRSYDKMTKLPSDLVGELSRHATIAQEIWVTSRAANDFESLVPALEKMFQLTRRQSDLLGYEQHPYDALIDLYEPGTTHADVTTLFEALKPALVKLTAKIAAAPTTADDSLLKRGFPIDAQRDMTLKMIEAIGFDMQRGRQDVAAHPFCASFSRDDVRLTTRFDENWLSAALYASMHEAGHGLYEQGYPAAFDDTPLAGAASLGVHESQSRLWENLVGRSLPFSRWLFPQLQKTFPGTLDDTDAVGYYRAINCVAPSFIRVEADEVTYNLHILLRFELESAVLTGDLAVRDLPNAWNEGMRRYLGITPPSPAVGVLQDVHWSCGLVGYFPTYTIGNLLSAQLFAAARRALPGLNAQIEAGEFGPLLCWLRDNVHAYGAKYLPRELVPMAAGEPLNAAYYADYLTEKYNDLYGISE